MDDEPHKEVSQVLITPEGQRWLNEHKPDIEDRIIPLVTSKAAITRIGLILMDKIKQGEDPQGYSITERFMDRTLKDIKEAVPEMPEIAVNVCVAFSLERLMEAMKRSPDRAARVFALAGIEIDTDSIELDYIPVPNNTKE